MVKAIMGPNFQKLHPGVKAFIQGTDVRRQKTRFRSVKLPASLLEATPRQDAAASRVQEFEFCVARYA
jgi:hypothetical protein